MASAPLHALQGDAAKRAASYVARMGPATQGQHGDDHTYKVAAALVVDFALPPDVALTVLREWNATCQPPWPDRDLVAKLRSAAKYGRHDRGAKLRESDIRLDVDAAYDVAGVAAFVGESPEEITRALANFDAALKWKGPMRSVRPLDRQTALYLAMFVPGRVERGPERIPWIMEQASREHYSYPPKSTKRADMLHRDGLLDGMATPQAVALPDDPEAVFARKETLEQFRASLSPLEQRVFDQPFSESDKIVAGRVGTTSKTVKSTRQRIRDKARAWGKNTGELEVRSAA